MCKDKYVDSFIISDKLALLLEVDVGDYLC